MKPEQSPEVIEHLTQQIGRALWDRLEHHAPSIFDRQWWDDRILAWAMADESVKVQMFRFIDVLPTLRTREAITRHLQEYFEEVNEQLPRAARMALEVSHPDSVLGRALAIATRRNALRMAKRFIAGTEPAEVLQTVAKLRKQGFAFTLDLLGEAITSEEEADAYLAAYQRLITELTPLVVGWTDNPTLDRDGTGSVPRVNLSLKLSALYSQFSPVDPEGTEAGVGSRLRPLLRCARQHGAYLHIDMEHYAFKDLTLAIVRDVLMEDEFRDFADVGIVIQAYLPDAERDLHEMLDWVQRRGTPVWVRLVKGAYWDYETVVAASRGWPVPVYLNKWQSDDNFERQTEFLMRNHRWLRPALGSHNLRSLAHGLGCAKHFGVAAHDFEIQMLYGMGADQARLFAEHGHRVRIYTPFGQLIPGMAYLVRRLLENTSNDSFLRASFAENVSVKELLMKPTDHARVLPSPPGRGAGGEGASQRATPRFVNEPQADFARADARRTMQHALDDVSCRLGESFPLVIGGETVTTEKEIVSINPSHVKQVVGRTASAGVADANAAVEAAQSTFKSWSRVAPTERADWIDRVAAKLRERRFELAAWEVFECGKPWGEADADVAEAIDFCSYYAAEMRRLAMPRQHDVPGEENSYTYRPRGVAVVIAPWNFPLAILTGMTAAAVVTGNTVVMKPAEQSPIIAAKLMQIFREIDLPEGVVNFLPGVGEEIGPTLVNHPDVALIAFTGSQAVGLAINQQAAVTDKRQDSVKRVIAEMGGKNAIIVDDDANLDEAVLGVIQSAFGYAGQKCSACSRVIVVDDAHDEFVSRLVNATRSLRVGPAEHPGTFVGPVIDAEARDRIQRYIEIGKQEATLTLAYPVAQCSPVSPRPDGSGHGVPLLLSTDLGSEGFYIGPHIFTNVRPDSRIAQEEIFGPVLAVLRAKSFDEALEIANGTRYALTGGVFSRSPGHLRQARQEFAVGNLYLNRSITGALVERHPFGGFKMSGIGSKAGGPDYLLQFLIPVNITENTLRRGFAPQEDDKS
ncbi:MAG: L-glutamate gamma-semialdehyde dehydrogenase [Planctomycetales bacterium]|nr:L-glutamate gamma-semialdehyde dehydrogenase [Planctomycetales bacterium]